MAQSSRPGAPVTPTGLNHLVLNVRDLEESHRFWTEIPRFCPCRHVACHRGTSRSLRACVSTAECVTAGTTTTTWRWSRDTSLPGPGSGPVAVNHVAVTLPDRDAFVQQLAFLQEKGGGIRPQGRARDDTQRLHPRPQRLRGRVALRASTHRVGRRYRGGTQLREGACRPRAPRPSRTTWKTRRSSAEPIAG